jgi:hypothetical protein
LAIYNYLSDTYAALKQPIQAAGAWRKSLAVEPDSQIQNKLEGLPVR